MVMVSVLKKIQLLAQSCCCRQTQSLSMWDYLHV